MLAAKSIAFNPAVPWAVRREIHNMEESESPERSLFQSIVMRATLDALGMTSLDTDDHHEIAVGESRRWFKFGDNVEEYCVLAGIGPNFRRIMLNAIKEQKDNDSDDN